MKENYINKKCDCCGADLLAYEYGGTKCKKCGWIDDSHQREYPDCSNSNNLISLNRARQLYKEGKKFMPTFEEFIDMVKRGFEFTFTLKNKKYGIYVVSKEGWGVIDCSTNEILLQFNPKDEFVGRLIVNGASLKDNWHLVTKIDYA